MAAPTTLNKWDVLNAIGWEPHRMQEEIVSSPARFRVVDAGRRFGKSDIGGHELVPECFLTYGMAERLREEGKRREFWITGPEYSDSEKEFRVIWNELKRQEVPFDKPGSYYNAESGQLSLSAWGGTFQVHGKSAKYPDTLVGEGLSGVILAEAAKLKERVWTKYIRPTLADFLGWAIFSSTPEGKNWFYELFKLGQDPNNTEWASWKCPAWLNPYVYRRTTNPDHVKQLLELLSDPKVAMSREFILENFQIDEEILSLMMSMSSETFNQEIGAEFTDFVGRVFKFFDSDIHVGDLSYNPRWGTFAGVDYGFTNPNVWLLIQVGIWGEINVLDEVYEPGLTANEFAALVERRGLAPRDMIRFYPDPASPGDTRILENALKVRSAGGTGGERNHRIDAIRRALKMMKPHLPSDHPENRPYIMFDRKCVRTINDMESWKYPENRRDADANKPEDPEKKNDHGPEALGRFFAGYYGTPQTDARRTRQKRARVRG